MKKLLNLWSTGIPLCALLAFMTTLASAQMTTATLFGTVTDKTGAIVSSAKVTITNTATGLTKVDTTTAAGEYRVEFLPVGQYKIDVGAPGFANFSETGIVLGVGQTAKIDISLGGGSVIETVDVTAATPSMNTGNAEVGTTVENVQVTELPIVNRNVYTLLNVIPGVQQNSNQAGLGLPEQHTEINGGIEAGYSGTVNYFLDGGENVTSLRNAGNILPNPDSIQEFRVEALNYSAEYGRFANGVINVVTKSGANTVHGSMFEFWRNDKLNALSWHQTTAKAPLHRNQFGATLGGPILRDRTFFFGSYAGLRETTAAFIPGTIVPTALERNASGAGYDFSQSAKKPLDPDTAHSINGVKQPYSCNGQLNVICPSQVDPAAANLLKAFVPNGNLPDGKWQGFVLTPDNNDEFLLKIDHHLNDSHQLIGSYFNTSGNALINAGNSPLPYARIQYAWRQQNINLSDLWTVNTRTVNQTWVTYTRAFGSRVSLVSCPFVSAPVAPTSCSSTMSLADFGSSFIPLGPKTMPNIGVTGYFNLGDQIAGPNAGTNFYSVRDLVSMDMGKHSLRLGFEESLNKDAQYTNLNNFGNFSFNGGITGNGLADYLIGVPSSAGQDQPVRPSTNTFVTSLFAQDDYRLTRRLTLNLGLRWDLQTVPTDPRDLQDTYVPGSRTTLTSKFPNVPTGLLFPGDPGVSRGIAKFSYAHISPRVGFAMDPFGDGKTAVRGALGLFFGGVSGNGWNQPSNFQPFTVSLSFPNANSAPHANAQTGATLSNPYFNYPGGNPLPYNGTTFIVGSTVKTIDLGFKWPYSYQTNFSIQRQLLWNMSLNVGYVGSFSRNIPFLVDLNYPNPTIAGASASAANILSRRPNPALGQVQQMKSIVSANYNSLQVVLEKRLSNSLSLTSSYVFSKTLVGAGVQNTTASAQDYNNLTAEYGSADTDQRHAFSTGAVWQINYLHGGNFILRQVANGWQISPILRLATGVPLGLTNGIDANLDGNSTDRPALVGNWRIPKRTAAAWFNTAAFKTNPAVTGAPVDGTTPRNFIFGPGLEQLDLGLARSFQLYERVHLELRGEATNALNHVNLGTPGTNANAPSTFGVITGAQTMRQMQLGARITF